MKNEIRFTLESKQRPKLAQEIGNILGTAPHYERVPSCAYDIAGYRLDKEGVLHIPEGAEETSLPDIHHRCAQDYRRTEHPICGPDKTAGGSRIAGRDNRTYEARH